MTEDPDIRWIAGFWRRIGAFAIDLIILGVFGVFLGTFLEERFVQLGGWGRCVGLLVGLFYFGFLNSRIFGGQTVGKTLLRIRVVDSDNQPIGLLRSCARYGILGVPFFLEGSRFTDEAATSFWVYPISFLIYGGMSAIVYLYVSNRATRQSLHDLAVGTYVVNAGLEKQNVGAIWRPHLIVVAVIFLVSALSPVLTSKLLERAPFKDLSAAQSALIAHPSVTYAGVSSGISATVSTRDGKTTTTYLSAQVFLKNNTVSDAELAKQLAEILVYSHTNSRQMDAIQILLTYGYDIGIWSKWTNRSYLYRPADLMGES